MHNIAKIYNNPGSVKLQRAHRSPLEATRGKRIWIRLIFLYGAMTEFPISTQEYD